MERSEMLTGPSAEYIRGGLLALQGYIEEWAVSKGWREQDAPPREPLHLIMLMVTELSEAAEAFRNHNPPCSRPGMEHFSHVEEELADAVIRIFHMADEFDFDLAGAIIAKMKFNETRPYKHGGKTC